MTIHEYWDDNAIIAALSKKKGDLETWFMRREDVLEQVVKEAVAGNTFRAFRRMPQRPSAVFRNWAVEVLDNERTITTLFQLRSQAAYDQWIESLSISFRRTWQEQMRVVLPYGASRKLPDLLLKHYTWWSGLKENQRRRLIDYLHVPLDSYTLVGIRHCIDDPEIPADATMKFVAGPTMYNQIQKVIRGITKRAKVPAIYYDVLAWRMGR